MNLRICRLLAIAAFAVACVLGGAQGLAQNAYITNCECNIGNTVSVIDTATNTVNGSPITVGEGPLGVAVTPDGSKVYITNHATNNAHLGSVSVIDTATNSVSATISDPRMLGPNGVAVRHDGSKAYVASSAAYL
jgi:YVTN family beta-propeller protein